MAIFPPTILTASAMSDTLVAVGGVFVALSALAGVFFGARAARYTRAATAQAADRQLIIDRDHNELEGIKVVQASMQQTNAELRLDNEQLRKDRAADRKEHNESVAALRKEMVRRDQECKGRIAVLTRRLEVLTEQLVKLGGVPHE